MSIDTARAHLARHGLAERIIEFEVSSATVALAAQAALEGRQLQPVLF